MLADVRIKKIKEILREYKHIDITTLSSLLSVSMATVRRDLDKLENDNFLVRAHGGAYLNELSDVEVQLSDIDDPFEPQKREIGILASALVNDNDVIFIGSGSTCTQIAKHIKDKHSIVVVTNNVNVIFELAGNSDIKVQSTGGDLETTKNNLTLSGDVTLDNLRTMFFNKAFVSVDAIDLDAGYFSNSPQQGKIIRLLEKNSEELIIAADYSKFGKKAFSYVGDMTMSKKIVTNVALHDSFKKRLFENGFQLYMSFENQ
jgi:DeoR/GlpR family transcriptional regulator of sugar metabolism